MRRTIRDERGEGLPSFIAGILVVVVIVAGLFFLFGYRSVDAGQVALRFGGGALDAKNGQYKGVYGPGRHNMGISDRIFPYPDTVRNYQFAPMVNNQLTGDAPSVPCVTKGAEGQVGPQIAMNGQFVFFLNTQADPKSDSSPLGDFHKLYGVRYHAYEHFDDETSDVNILGWPKMLNETFRPNAESVIVAACRNFTVDDLSKQESINAFETAVGTEFTKRIHDRMKGQFFIGGHNDAAATIEFQMKPVLPPAGLADAANRLAVAQKNLEAAKVEAKQIEALAEKGLTGMAAVAHECLQVKECRDNMTFVGGDAGVTIPAK
jgi:hypothetical protein